MKKQLNNVVKIALSMGLLISTGIVYAADCTSVPVDPAGDTTKLQEALQQATNTGKSIDLTGTYYIDDNINVYLKKELTVNATEATFIATSDLDGDMFSIDNHATHSSECDSEDLVVDVTWTGGNFNMADAKVSTVVPEPNKTPADQQGTQATADALSVRSANNAENTNKVNQLIIEDITFSALKNSSDPYYLAGGDSGILVTGTLKAIIRNNQFYGVRDAAVYLSAGGDNGIYGDHFTITNNYAESAYDGFTSKRGADNVTMTNNTVHDVVVGLSVKRVYDGWTATDINISNNTITDSVRPISVERAQNVTITENDISNLGAIVASSTTPINKYGDQYEGIALNGVQGTNLVADNVINGIDGTREDETTTWGIVKRFEDGWETTGVTITNNTYSRLDNNIKEL